MKLKDKKILITGANRSIGKAIAQRFAQEGGHVVITYRSDEMGAKEVVQTLQKTSGFGAAIFADFSLTENITRCFDEACAILGHIDVLVNNAGSYDTSPFLDLDPKTFNHLLHVGVTAPMLLTQLVARKMKAKGSGGSIINIASVSGLKTHPCRVAHSTAKAALIMLTKSTALELAPFNIRVNALAPGGTPYEGESWGTELVPLGVEGIPEYQASGALYLASDEASWVTGQVLAIDGGQTII
jgi:NAD(P)-dependent dehydrogenase (short-subunit alcohol dehydrogenase family)